MAKRYGETEIAIRQMEVNKVTKKKVKGRVSEMG